MPRVEVKSVLRDPFFLMYWAQKPKPSKEPPVLLKCKILIQRLLAPSSLV
ncbi:MAG: hypothetical protein DDT35_00525 [Firmicutes bacterium]|nr:hypothetical protein [Bacillota bacterium]